VIPHWWAETLTEITATSALEWTAIATAVAEVLLAKANKVLLYPAGIISTVIYIYLFLQPKAHLYADAILNIYYLVMSVYGWVLWAQRREGKVLAVGPADRRDWLVTLAISLGGWAVLYVLLTRIFPLFVPYYTVSDVAVWDAVLSSTAWAGMWLLAKRRTENWLLLNISNAIAIPVYLYKGMPFTALLTLFLFVVAIFGYIEWRKQYQRSLQR